MSGTNIDELARLLAAAAEAPDGADENVDAAEGRELAELVSLASSLRAVPGERPRAEFRDALRVRLLRESAQMLPAVAGAPAPPSLAERVRARLADWRRSTAVAAASATGAFALGSAGMVAAAEHAQPGEALYGVKLTTETVRISLAADAEAVGRLELAFAERRLQEIRSGAGTLPSDTLIDILGSMDEHTERGAEHLLDAYADDGDAALLRDLAEFTARQHAGLVEVAPDLPVRVAPFLEVSLGVLEQVRARLAAVGLGCADCEVDPATGDGDPVVLPSLEPDDAPDVDEPDARDEEGQEPTGSDPEPEPDVTATAGPTPSLPEIAPSLPTSPLPEDPEPLPDAEPTETVDEIVRDIIESSDDPLGD